MTKIELQQANTRLSEENALLRAACSRYITQIEAIKALQTDRASRVNPAKYNAAK